MALGKGAISALVLGLLAALVFARDDSLATDLAVVPELGWRVRFVDRELFEQVAKDTIVSACEGPLFRPPGAV